MVIKVEFLEVAYHKVYYSPEKCCDTANISQTCIEGIDRVCYRLLVSGLREVDNETCGNWVRSDAVCKLLPEHCWVDCCLIWFEEEVVAQVEPLKSPKTNLGLHQTEIEAVWHICLVSHLWEIALGNLGIQLLILIVVIRVERLTNELSLNGKLLLHI